SPTVTAPPWSARALATFVCDRASKTGPCSMADSQIRSGACVLMVSHDTDAIAGHCTRAILLEQGRVINDGPARTVVERYTRWN
ncbi:MAG: hypothetical protein AABY13_04355, partial [Nanoarchaeota archaeon]